MPPQIKTDLNRSGWETTDFPSVCEKCLPDNPYVQMLKEDHGAVSIAFRSHLARIGLHITGMQDLHTTFHNLPLESRPHSATEAHKHLPDMRASKELLPVLHARSFVRSAPRCP
jgi:hypothetical protein